MAGFKRCCHNPSENSWTGMSSPQSCWPRFPRPFSQQPRTRARGSSTCVGYDKVRYCVGSARLKPSGMRGSPIAVKYRVLVTKIPFIAVVGYARPCFRFKETVLRNERVSKCCKIQDFVPKIPLTTVAGYARPCFGRKETVFQNERVSKGCQILCFGTNPLK